MKYVQFRDLVWLLVLSGSLWAVQELNVGTIKDLQQEVNRLKQANRYTPSTLTIYEP